MSEQHAGLSQQFIEQQHERLLALRRQLLGGEQATLAGERKFQRQHGDEAEEFEEKAQDRERMEVEQALHDVDDCRIANIERALQKIEDGSYGLSDLSGQRIPKARLESTPESNRHCAGRAQPGNRSMTMKRSLSHSHHTQTRAAIDI